MKRMQWLIARGHRDSAAATGCRRISRMPFAMIDRKPGRDEPAPPALADDVAAMRAEIQRLREELQLAKAA
ncbi:hypothetical protein [Longimicrobium sp.]|uniref:hypothetical protein n=1 Tax=Longimicrobium sp. TaxID=2029185 RepID=UPI002D7EFEB5|nr:hypothetical protein [Longimicrobium sp.]